MESINSMYYSDDDSWDGESSIVFSESEVRNAAGSSEILDIQSNTWTHTEDKILEKYLKENPELTGNAPFNEEAVILLKQITDELGYFSQEEILTRFKKIMENLSQEPCTTTHDETPIFWTDEDEETLTKFCKLNPKVKSGVAREKKKKEALFGQLMDQLPRYTRDQIEKKIVDISGAWRLDDVDTLISFYRDNSCLWNPHLAEYHNKIKKAMLLEELVAALGGRKSVQEIEDRFAGLKKTHTAKTKNKPTGSAGQPAVNKPTGSAVQPADDWPYLKPLAFLKSTSTQRTGVTNISKRPAEDPNDTEPNSPKVGGKKAGRDPDDEFKAAIIKSLEDKSYADDSFGAHISGALQDFTKTNRAFVKLQLQSVLAHCLLAQENGKQMPTFTPNFN